MSMRGAKYLNESTPCSRLHKIWMLPPLVSDVLSTHRPVSLLL